MAEMWKAGRGHLLLVARTHLFLCSITFNHQPPRVCSSASWHCSICPRRFGSPRGDFVTDTSGWGGEGQAMRHEGVEEMSVAIEKVPRMGWGGGHPSMSQLKRWCFTSMSCTPSFSGFFSFSCRMTQRPRSVHHTQKRTAKERLCLRAEPEHTEALAPRAASCASHLCTAGTGRGLWFGEHRGKGA